MARPLFSIGGCAYMMRVDGRVAGDIAMLASLSTADNASPSIAAISFQHTSNLPSGRMLWLRDQLAMSPKLKWAISVDSDTSFSPHALLRELHQVDASIAVGLAPVRIGGSKDTCNLCITEDDEMVSAQKAPSMDMGRRMFQADLTRVLAGDRRIASGGFGLAVFNLDWYRTCWPDPAPEFVSITTGEDIEHCRSVRSRGGGVVALNVRTDHYGWGEAQTR